MAYFYKTREQASKEAAKKIAAALNLSLATQEETSLVVSGGTTPARCYRELSKIPAEWARVSILLSDERWVMADDENSNEKLIRQTLLRSNAKLFSVYNPYLSIIEQNNCLKKLLTKHMPSVCCSLIGMGEDGHFASLFPDSPNLAEGLNLCAEDLCMTTTTAASPFQRWSLKLAALLQSKEIILLFFGESKLQIYNQAKISRTAYPISKLLSKKQTPVTVIWAA